MEKREQLSYEPALTAHLSPVEQDSPIVEQIRLYRSPEWEGVRSPEIEGARLMVPRYNIFGIQPVEDYSRVTERKIIEGYQQDGINLLYESPVWLCAIIENSITTLALMDGHHRARYAGKFDIQVIPSIVFTPEQAVVLWNENPRCTKPITVDEYIEMMEEGMSEALKSFDRICRDSKLPKHIPGVDSIEDLTQRFASF